MSSIATIHILELYRGVLDALKMYRGSPDITRLHDLFVLDWGTIGFNLCATDSTPGYLVRENFSQARDLSKISSFYYLHVVYVPNHIYAHPRH